MAAFKGRSGKKKDSMERKESDTVDSCSSSNFSPILTKFFQKKFVFKFFKIKLVLFRQRMLQFTFSYLFVLFYLKKVSKKGKKQKRISKEMQIHVNRYE